MGVKKKAVNDTQMRAVMGVYKEAETLVKLESKMSEWFQMKFEAQILLIGIQDRGKWKYCRTLVDPDDLE